MSQDWSLSSIIYQIYPRSFQDSNDDGIGDLRGIIRRLDYLTSLGINAIWLSPVYPSPMADFGYDIADYESIDPLFGSMNDFDELIEKAHARGIKILMDYVPNHTSNQHPWFISSRSSKADPKRDWYIWANPKPDGSPPNNWLSCFGGPAWEFDKDTKQYYLHIFTKEQPDLNWRNPHVAEAMLNVLRFWMKRGVSGFRVDASEWMFKDIDLRSEPENQEYDSEADDPHEFLKHIYTSDMPEAFTVLRTFSDCLKEFENTFMVTEAYTSMDNIIKKYKTVNWKNYASFNFQMIKQPWKADVQKKMIDRFDKELGDLYTPCYVLGNHDRSRVTARLGEPQARIAAMLLFALRGVVFLYYGEEIGLSNGCIPEEYIHDPFALNYPDRGIGRDPERTPMQWDTTNNAGFTAGDPWLPVNPDYKKCNVQEQEKCPTSFLSLYKLLIKLKAHHPALSDGRYIPLPMPADNVFAFLREAENERLLTVLNFDDRDKTIHMDYSGSVLLDARLEIPKKTKINLGNFLLRGDEGIIVGI